MTRLLTTILTLFALMTFASAAQANHHGSAEVHGSHTDQTKHAKCTHAADESCPKAKGPACEHHDGDKPCTCAESGHDHGSKKSEAGA